MTLVAGCGLAPQFEATSSVSAQDSFQYCQQGATCVLKPMAMVVLNKANPAISFDFRSWMLYDNRPTPVGHRYLALMNEMNDPVCEGFYTTLGINITSPIAMKCFPRGEQGRGEIRFDALQREGRFAGKSAGVGLIETSSETVLFVHGATPDENRKASFKTLWDKYGGKWVRPISVADADQKRVPSLPRLIRARPPLPSTAADNR